MKHTKKMLAFMLALTMLFGLLPFTAIPAAAQVGVTCDGFRFTGTPFGNPEGGDPARAFDGNPSTTFSTNIHGPQGDAYIGLDTGEMHVLTKVRVLPSAGWEADHTIARVEGSVDGINWERLNMPLWGNRETGDGGRELFISQYGNPIPGLSGITGWVDFEVPAGQPAYSQYRLFADGWSRLIFAEIEFYGYIPCCDEPCEHVILCGAHTCDACGIVCDLHACDICERYCFEHLCEICKPEGCLLHICEYCRPVCDEDRCFICEPACGVCDEDPCVCIEIGNFVWSYPLTTINTDSADNGSTGFWDSGAAVMADGYITLNGDFMRLRNVGSFCQNPNMEYELSITYRTDGNERNRIIAVGFGSGGWWEPWPGDDYSNQSIWRGVSYLPVSEEWTTVTFTFFGGPGFRVVLRSNPGSLGTWDIAEITVREAVPPTWNVIYDYQGGAGKHFDRVLDKESVLLPSPRARDGFIFQGWEDANGNYIGGAGFRFYPTAGITLSASWLEGNADEFTVNYNYGIGSGGVQAVVIIEGNAAVLPAAGLAAHIFFGWYTQPDGQGIRVGGIGDGFAPASDITLYAHFVLMHTVTYNYGAGSNVLVSFGASPDAPLSSGLVAHGSSTTLPGAVRRGFIFDGWSDGDDIVGKAGEEYFPVSTHTLTAQFSPLPADPGNIIRGTNADFSGGIRANGDWGTAWDRVEFLVGAGPGGTNAIRITPGGWVNFYWWDWAGGQINRTETFRLSVTYRAESEMAADRIKVGVTGADSNAFYGHPRITQASDEWVTAYIDLLIPAEGRRDLRINAEGVGHGWVEIAEISLVNLGYIEPECKICKEFVINCICDNLFPEGDFTENSLDEGHLWLGAIRVEGDAGSDEVELVPNTDANIPNDYMIRLAGSGQVMRHPVSLTGNAKYRLVVWAKGGAPGHNMTAVTIGPALGTIREDCVKGTGLLCHDFWCGCDSARTVLHFGDNQGWVRKEIVFELEADMEGEIMIRAWPREWQNNWPGDNWPEEDWQLFIGQVRVELVEVFANVSTVTFDVAAETGGVLEATVGLTPFKSGSTVAHNRMIHVTAIADPGYVVENWIIDGVTVAPTDSRLRLSGTRVSLYVSEDDLDIQVRFKEADLVAVSYDLNCANSGTITAEAVDWTFVSGDNIPEGLSLAFTATPNPGFEVKYWIVNGSRVYTTTQLFTVASLKGSLDIMAVFGVSANEGRNNHNGTNKNRLGLNLVRPDSSSLVGGLEAEFSQDYLNSIDPFGVLRFMDFTSTNSHVAPGTGQWENRVQPDAPNQNGAQGAAWEYVIALANASKKDLWISLPVRADNDYIYQLANLMLEHLNPDLTVYVEWGNEVWGFEQQVAVNREMARAAGIPGEGENLWSWRNSSGMYGWGDMMLIRHFAQRSAEIGLIFREVFGESGSPISSDSRVKPIITWQTMPDFITPMLDWLNNHSDPKFHNAHEYIYSAGIAPYFQEPRPQDCDPAGARRAGFGEDVIAYIHSHMRNSIRSGGEGIHPDGTPMGVVGNITTLLAATLRAGFVGSLTTYEAGPHHQGQVNSNLTWRTAAQKDPAMADIIMYYIIDHWYDIGGGLMMYFSHIGPSTQYGYWGNLDNLSLEQFINAPKFAALRAISQIQYMDCNDCGSNLCVCELDLGCGDYSCTDCYNDNPCDVCGENPCICVYCDICGELEDDCVCVYCDKCGELEDDCVCVYCDICGELEDDCTCEKEAYLVSASTNAGSFVSMIESSKNSRVWILTFMVTEVYSDGTSKAVTKSISLGGNNANLDGVYVFGSDDALAGFKLIYDIKGNGSNIKELKLI